ncbi:MAG TPA: hypothetical protein VF475_09040 [Sphingobium sp.]
MTVNAETGERELVGRDALPWATDTLAIGGDIRAKLIRLQDWVATLLAR